MELARIATDAVAFVAQQQRWQQREDSKAGRVLCRARAVAAEAGKAVKTTGTAEKAKAAEASKKANEH